MAWLALLGLLALRPAIQPTWQANSYEINSTADSFVTAATPFTLRSTRPPECPPCFNCQLPAFKCHQFGKCNKFNGKCDCPPGFGGDDCAEPLCGSLPDGRDRTPRKGSTCQCKDGWSGINCNMCETNDACNAMMPEKEGGVCYRHHNGGETIAENYQMCEVTNRKIRDMLKEKKPQVTFSCKKEDKTCNFQCECWPCLLYSYVDCLRSQLTGYLYLSSLGRSTRILLLFAGYMQVEHGYNGEPEYHHLSVR